MAIGTRLLGAALLSTALVTLALLVFFNNRRAVVNRVFALSVLTIVGWVLSISLALSIPSLAVAVQLGRLAFAFAAAMPFTLLWMFHAFPIPEAYEKKRVLAVPAVACCSFIAISFTPWVVVNATQRGGQTNFVYGPLHQGFSVYVVVCFSLAIFLLWRKSRVASGLRQLQLRYLLLGIALGGAGVITTNLLFPLLWNTSKYSALGPYFSLLMVSFSAHAIIRHRLLDIRVFVKRGVVYLLAAAISGLFFAGLIWLVATQTATQLHAVPLQFQVALALLVALAFNPMKRWIQARLDRYLYRESYDYQRIVRDASRRISRTLDLKILSDYLCDTIGRALRPDLIAVFVRDRTGNGFPLVAQHVQVTANPLPTDLQLPASTPLLASLSDTGLPLVKDEAPQYGSSPSQIIDALKDLSALGAAVAAPMVSEKRLVGLLLLGPKLSGDPYFADDIELLTTLANQAATAADNAQLYGQVVLANEYVENILRTMDSGVIAINDAGYVVVVNTTAEHLTGLSRETLRTMHVDALPTPISAELKATLQDGQPRLQLEGVLSGSVHPRIPIVYSTSALRTRSGTIHGALVVFSDLSKLKALETEKRRVERLAAFGTLASGIAHEIKNPLVAIRTFAELLPERFAEADFRDEFAKIVITEIDRIDNLVARLKGLAGTTPKPARPVDVREPLAETLALLRPTFEQTRIDVVRDFRDPRPLIAVDPNQLKQLFLNVCLNALEAMSNGGRLKVSVFRKVKAHGQWVTVEIADTGPGIPESIRASIFDPFFTTKPRGSGLGLAVCRGITDAHHGSIQALPNETGVGTTIIIEFPAVDLQSFMVEEVTIQV